MTEAQARDEVCRVGRSLFERGYVHATAGNISVQLPPSEGAGWLITPTDACLGFLEPRRLARVDAQGQQTSGDAASKTLVLHRQIYAASQATPRPARCIIHTHSTHCVALSLLPQMPPPSASPQAELLPALTPYFVMKVGHVPRIAYHRPGDPQAAQAVADCVTRYNKDSISIRAVMLERLGPNVWHDSPAAAMAVLEELEETAKLWLLNQRQTQALSDAQIEELRQNFGAVW